MRRLGALALLLSLLVIGPPARPAATGPLSQGRVPVLIVLRDQADVRAPAMSPKVARGQAVWRALQARAAADQPRLLALLRSRGAQGRGFIVVNAISAEIDAATTDLLRRDPSVASIIPDPPRQMALPTPEPAAAEAPAAVPEWGVRDIRADEVWASYGVTGTGVVLAGQDTGMKWDHPALKPHYRGWDGALADHAYSWHDAIHADLSGNGANICGFNSAVPCDDHGHGTHTVGTMVGDDGAGRQIGVAPGARWIGCRNMEQGFGTIATYVECFDWFLAPRDPQGQNPRPDLAPDIVNNSWSCPPDEGCEEGTIAAIEPAIDALTAAGILVVGSAGNEGGRGCGSLAAPPSIYPATFSVGAYDSSGTLAGFSNRGPVTYGGVTRIGPDIAGPGVNVVSAVPSGYSAMSGTSMASPHVAGAAALLWSARPWLRGQVEATRAVLEQTARPAFPTTAQCGSGTGDRPNNLFGWGRVDAFAALSESLPATLIISVTRRADGTPLPGVEVTARGPITATGATGADGAVTLTLLAGSYEVTVAGAIYSVRQQVEVTGGDVGSREVVLPPHLNLLPLIVQGSG